MRSPCKLFAYLAGTRRSCLPTKAAAFFLFDLHLSRQGSPINRPSLWLRVGAWRMQTVCLSGLHSQELLANKGCHLPLCFAPKPSGISDQSSKLAAARRCVAETSTHLESTSTSHRGAVAASLPDRSVGAAWTFACITVHSPTRPVSGHSQIK